MPYSSREASSSIAATTEPSLLTTVSFVCNHRSDTGTRFSGKRFSEVRGENELKHNGYARLQQQRRRRTVLGLPLIPLSSNIRRNRVMNRKRRPKSRLAKGAQDRTGLLVCQTTLHSTVSTKLFVLLTYRSATPFLSPPSTLQARPSGHTEP